MLTKNSFLFHFGIPDEKIFSETLSLLTDFKWFLPADDMRFLKVSKELKGAVPTYHIQILQFFHICPVSWSK